MDRLLNISDRTNAALHALALVARSGSPLSAAHAAEELGVSASYLAKTLQPIAKAGLLESTRGAAGGFILSKDPARITCLDVMELLDGPLPTRSCLFEKQVCPRGTCALKRLCDETQAAIRTTLAATTVADLAASFN